MKALLPSFAEAAAQAPFLALLLCMFTSCMPYDLTKVQADKVNQVYEESIEDAVYPTTKKVDSDLFAITKQNPALTWQMIEGEEYVLMLSWKGDDTYYKPPYVKNGIYNTGDKYPIWVTAAPQLASWAAGEPQLQNWVRDGEIDKVNYRLKQLLGLPPNPKYTYKYFIEFWVKPADLFRPCPDSEISDETCTVCFPANIDSTYQAWINNTRAARFYDPCDLLDKYPWTALGYTYDWSPRNASHQGLSEYVIKNNSNIIVKQIYTTEEYLKKGI